MTEENQLPNRSEVPTEQTWDLASIFATPADWENACRSLEAMLPSIIALQGHLQEGPQVLLEAIEKLETGGTLIGKINTYAGNASAVDTTDQVATARAGQARSLDTRYRAAASFFDPELMRVGLETIKGWMGTTPALNFFAFYVDRLEQRAPHVRSGEVEELLAMTGDSFAGAFHTFSMLNNADLKFKSASASDGSEKEVGQASIGALVTHSDRAVRRSAWQNYSDGYLGFKNTYAAVLTTAVKQDVFFARARRYETSLHASLEPNNIPVAVFHNLIEVFRQNLPTWQRYWRLRRRILKLDTLGVYDVKAPLAPMLTQPSVKPIIPFRQAVDWICAGMAPLGEEYVKTLRRGCLEERWVDQACNRGKREGAFSSGSHGTRSFIMMSYQNDIFSLSTLAHELGHSMHSTLSRANQRFLYSRYGLFAAEVASNFNQAMVRDHLFQTQTDPGFQVALIEEAMSNYHRYFFLMPTLARFELEVHTRAEKGAPLNADILTGILADFFKEGYGEEVEFDRERIGITWAQFLHMYMNFYVYQYATGISAADALVRGVVSGSDPQAAGRYLDFLRSGGARYPLDALKLAGVDMISPEPVHAAFAVLAKYVERLETLFP